MISTKKKFFNTAHKKNSLFSLLVEKTSVILFQQSLNRINIQNKFT